MKIFITTIAFIFFGRFGLSGQEVSKSVSQNTDSTCSCSDSLMLIDHSINSFFIFGGYAGIANIVGEKKFKNISKAFVSNLVFRSIDNKEYLRVLMLSYNPLVFDLRCYDFEFHDNYQTLFYNFKTEKGIFLGMEEIDFLKIFNQNYFNTNTNKDEKNYILKKITVKSGSPYNATYTFQNERLVRFAFGFDNFPN